ncbi:unnamed protein product [Cochlearia groenlandica]
MSKKIILTTMEGDSFEVDKAVALKSKTIKHIIDDGCAGEPIPLPNVSAPILTKVIEYCKIHTEKILESNDLVAWDAEFVKVDQPTIFALIEAADYLNICDLLDLTCKTVADMMAGKNAEEIRALFNIVNDYTPEEEEEVRREIEELNEKWKDYSNNC